MRIDILKGCFERFLKKSKIHNFVKTSDGKQATFYTFAYKGNMFMGTLKESDKFRYVIIKCITNQDKATIKELFTFLAKIKPQLEKGGHSVMSCGTDSMIIIQQK